MTTSVSAALRSRPIDQELGEDEEHVDTDIAATEEADAGVDEHDEEDSDGAETWRSYRNRPDADDAPSR